MSGLTPMLAIMAGESPDRRQRYDDRLREEGHVKRTYWVPGDLAEDIRDIMRLLVDAKGGKRLDLARAVIKTTAKVARGEGPVE